MAFLHQIGLTLRQAQASHPSPHFLHPDRWRWAKSAGVGACEGGPGRSQDAPRFDGGRAALASGCPVIPYPPARTSKSDALLTAAGGFEPSVSSNLPSGQQGACGHSRQDPRLPGYPSAQHIIFPPTRARSRTAPLRPHSRNRAPTAPRPLPARCRPRRWRRTRRCRVILFPQQSGGPAGRARATQTRPAAGW